jgi:hypothetical protein
MEITVSSKNSFSRGISTVYRCHQSTRDFTDVHVVPLGNISAKQFRFTSGSLTRQAFEAFGEIASRIVLPADPSVSDLMLFSVPFGLTFPIPTEASDRITYLDRTASVKRVVNNLIESGALQLDSGKLSSNYRELNKHIQQLSEKGFLSICHNPFAKQGAKAVATSVSNSLQFSNWNAINGNIVLNSHFFLMFLSDMATDFDAMGEPFGLAIHSNTIIRPPLYRRPAMVWQQDGQPRIVDLGIEDTIIRFDGVSYRANDNCLVYTRPGYDCSPESNGTDLAIVGKRIVAFSETGSMPIPEAGFVLHVPYKIRPKVASVDFYLEENYCFAVQVGPAVLRDKKPCTSDEYLQYSSGSVPFPPTVYPLDWENGRAARMAVAVLDGLVAIIHAGGSKSQAYRPGIDNLGLSLSELTDFASHLGCSDCLNLDGGGSATMRVDGKTVIPVSDRDAKTGGHLERPVPQMIAISLAGNPANHGFPC